MTTKTTATQTPRPRSLNALQHGILAREALIRTGDAAESEAEFVALDAAIRDQTAPEGAIEQLLVEHLIQLTWRWRRLIRYENAAIRAESSSAVAGVWSDESHRDDRAFYGYATARHDLDAELLDLDAGLSALDASDPLTVRIQLSSYVLDSAKSQFDVSIDDVLQLQGKWQDERDFTYDQIETVVKASCRAGGISRRAYWAAIRARLEHERDALTAQIARRDSLAAGAAELAAVPDAARRLSIQRYEAHLSRQFYRALHELHRFQSTRAPSPTAPPDDGPPPIAAAAPPSSSSIPVASEANPKSAPIPNPSSQPSAHRSSPSLDAAIEAAKNKGPGDRSRPRPEQRHARPTIRPAVAPLPSRGRGRGIGPPGHAHHSDMQRPTIRTP